MQRNSAARSGSRGSGGRGSLRGSLMSPPDGAPLRIARLDRGGRPRDGSGRTGRLAARPVRDRRGVAARRAPDRSAARHVRARRWWIAGAKSAAPRGGPLPRHPPTHSAAPPRRGISVRVAPCAGRTSRRTTTVFTDRNTLFAVRASFSRVLGSAGERRRAAAVSWPVAVALVEPRPCGAAVRCRATARMKYDTSAEIAIE